MAESIIVVNFKVESEAFQGLSELKQVAVNESFVVSQAGVIRKEAGAISIKEGFDTGSESMNDTAIGGLIGAVVGILGGPIGVLLGGSYGALIGSAVDATDSVENVSLVEKVCECLDDNSTSMIILASETEEGSVDNVFEKYDKEIVRFDAAEVAVEIEAAEELQRQMEKEARKQLRAEKKADFKQKIEDKRAELKAKFQKNKEENA